MYQFTYGGKKGTSFQLVEARELVVIRTKEAAPLSQLKMSGQARELLPNLLPVAAFPEANVTVYRCVGTGDGTPVAVRNAVRKTLKKENAVRFAGRVLKDPATGEIVVYTENLYLQFKDDVKKSECRALMKKHGVRVKEDLGVTRNSYFAEGPKGTGLKVFALAEKLLQLPQVECCHPELVRERKYKFVHPMQWHLKQTVVNGLTINQHVEAEAAWKITKGKGITIAVLDDGVDEKHEEFKGKITAPRDTILNLDDANPKHVADRHGTACAGVACAGGKKKAHGVAPQARLMPIRLGSIGSISEAKAFKWAADHGADVISCSWGPMDGSWWNPNDPLHFSLSRMPDSAKAAIDYAIEKGRGGKGCVIVWAAGNGNEDVKFDEYASYEKVIAVAACNDQGKRCVYSDFGDAVWCCFPSNDFNMPAFNHPKPLTPGIWTTDRTGKRGYNSGGFNAEHLVGDEDGKYTATFGGTSSACPGVAGVAALMLAANPDLTWQQVKEIIKNSCDRIDEQMGNYDANGHSPLYGYGRINALKAVQNAKAAAQKVTAASKTDFEINGTARFNKTGPVELAAGKKSAPVSASKPQRLLGLQLAARPFHPRLSIAYKIMVKNKGASKGKDGTFAGTKDRRRSTTGIALWPEGDLASRFTVEYAVKLKGRKTWVKAANGKWAGSSDEKKGRTVEGIVVVLKKK
ncbi:MAG TPA: peptidase S8 [Bacteroidetes bacterium]|nr:peptidase S8 [Bacteroidota bacterium]